MRVLAGLMIVMAAGCAKVEQVDYELVVQGWTNNVLSSTTTVISASYTNDITVSDHHISLIDPTHECKLHGPQYYTVKSCNKYYCPECVAIKITDGLEPMREREIGE